MNGPEAHFSSLLRGMGDAPGAVRMPAVDPILEVVLDVFRCGLGFACHALMSLSLVLDGNHLRMSTTVITTWTACITRYPTKTKKPLIGLTKAKTTANNAADKTNLPDSPRYI